MDFDSIISFLLILLFFVAPTLLKRFSQKKKTDVPSRAGTTTTEKAKKISLFERLGDQLREYAQTLEQEAKKNPPSPEDIWAHLADEQELPPSQADPFEGGGDTPGYGAEPMAEPPVFAAASMMPGKMMPGKKAVPKPERKRSRCDSLGSGSFRPPRRSSCHQLQQAIVWSEILSKPVALRQD